MIFISGMSKATLYNTTMISNYMAVYGAIYLTQMSIIEINSSTFKNNKADVRGGVIFSDQESYFII